MNPKQKEVRLYNALFPLWSLMFFPQVWLIVIPGNFIIDSIVLIISMAALKVADKKLCYKQHIWKIFGFGMLSDVIGSAYMILVMVVDGVLAIILDKTHLFRMGDEPLLTIPALIISAALIFVFNYFITFKKMDKPLRLKMSIIFAVVTAPYTFLIPSSWVYQY
ncbi:MAG: hypothetical protein IJZ02_05345 [Clostridia bacterium]|nr:hypothetical protein [Clostridia bacterium]